MTATAFQATYSDFKIIRGRKVCQIVLEVPLEAADAAMAVLGGVPRPDQETWVGVARIAPASPQGLPARPVDGKEDKSLVLRSVMLSDDKRFAVYVEQRWGMGGPTDYIRNYCGVQSRKDIVIGSPAASEFIALEADFYTWLAAERAGA